MKRLLTPPRKYALGMLCAALGMMTATDLQAQMSVQVTPSEYHGGQFHVSDHGATDGSISSAVSGGVEPYSYVWKRLEGAMGHTEMGTSQHLNGVGSGQYRLVVTDSTGTMDSASVFLSEPMPMMVMPQVTHLTCANGANGSVTLMVSGGVAPYSHLWSNGDTLSSTGGLGAGQHHVTVTSAGGAQRTEYFYVNAPMALGADIMQMTWAQCHGDTVVMTASAWGGTPPYSYHWNTGAFSSTVKTVQGGQYSVQVTDMHNCHGTDSLWVTLPEALSGAINYLPYPNGTPFSCDTCNDGVIQVTTNGGTQPHQIMWSTAHNGTVLHGMHADSAYWVSVTDMHGCHWLSDTIRAERGVAFEQQLGVFLFAEQYAGGHHVSHSGASDGMLEAVVVGGVPPYSILWNTGDTIAELDSLSSGYYSVTVTDQSGTYRTRSKTLTAPMPLSVSLTGGLGGCMAMGSQLNAFVNGGAPPYTYAWYRNDSLYDSTHNYPYLYIHQEGMYRVRVADANSDTVTTEMSVSAIAPLATTLTVTEVQPGYHATCHGDTVQLHLTVTGGTGPYSYMWEHGSFQKNPKVTGGGWKVVRVNDMMGCMREDSILVSMPAKLEVEVRPYFYVPGHAFSCDTCNDGILYIEHISGGLAPYSILWGDGSTGDTLTGVHADTVQSITVTDALGCVFQDTGALPRGDLSGDGGALVTTSQYPGGIHVSCAACTDGWIELHPHGGQPPYSYQWDDGDTSRVRHGLGVGSYGVSVSDVHGNGEYRQIHLIGPSSALTMYLGVQPPGCQSAMGHIDAYVNGGTPPYSYQWSRNDSVYDSMHQFSHLSIWEGGNYSVRVTDANADTVTSQIMVGSAVPMFTDLTATEVQPGHHATCHGDTVQLTLTVSGGMEPYSYMWEHGSFQKNPKVTSGGWKVVRVHDMMGCTRVDSIYVHMPMKLENKINPYVYANGQAFSCDTCNDGKFVLDSIWGGVGPYSHVWSNGSTGDTLHGIIPDTVYSITMTDALGCTVTESGSLPRTWNPEPPGLALTYDKSQYPGGYHVSCAGCMDGWIQLWPNGGTPPYTYQWMDGDSTQHRYMLMAGYYWVTVTDAQGQSLWREFTLLGPGGGLSASLSAQTPGCQSAEGHLYAHVNGGTPPYSYQWSRNDSVYDSMHQFSHLSIWEGGNYSVRVTDANADTVTSQIVVGSAVPMFTDLTATEVQPGHHATCHGDTVQLTLTVSGGMEPYMYMWEHGSFQKSPKVTSGGWKVVRVHDMMGCTRVDSIFINMPEELDVPDLMPHVYENGKFFSCDTCSDGRLYLPGVLGGVPPYSVLWSDGSTGDSLVGIAIDSMISITITDALGCVFHETGSLPWEWTPPAPDLALNHDKSFYAGGYHVSCAACMDGHIQLWPNGGTPPYTYQWMDGDSAQSRYGLMAGTYSVTVTDAQGQSLWRDFTLLGPGGGFSVHINNSSSNCRGTVSGSLNAMVMGGVPPYTYQWKRDGMPLMDMWNHLNVWQAGMYRVTVTDMNGQTAQDSVQVGMGAELTVTAEAVEKYGNAHTGCTVADGELVLHLSGGMPPYNVSVSWAGGHRDNLPIAESSYNHWFSTMETVAVVDSLRAGYYNISVSDMGGCYTMTDFEIRSPGQLRLGTEPMVHPNGHYVSCDTCADASLTATAMGAYGAVEFVWVQMPESEAPLQIRGASLFLNEMGGSGDAGWMFEAGNPYVVATGPQATGLEPEVFHALGARDALGCMGQKFFSVERPAPAAPSAPPAWGLYGNDSMGTALSPPEAEGELAAPWFGTGDSTDVVMKANGVPQLRLGANGMMTVEGQLRLAQLQEAAFDTTGPQLKLMVADGDGMLAKVGPDLLWAEMSRNPGGCFSLNPQVLEVTGQWFSGINKLYTCPQVNVGIGTHAPEAKLDVRDSDGNAALRVYNSGKVGIGTITPLLALDIAHHMPAGGMRLNRLGSGADSKSEIRFSKNGVDKYAIGNDLGNSGAQTFFIWDQVLASAPFVINGQGKVGIGTMPPLNGSIYKLYVEGGITTRDVKVTALSFPDYVFAKDYDLMSIAEVARHIDSHGHLPQFPSAAEVTANEGYELGDMQLRLLKTVEEQMLHIIHLQQQLDELKAKLDK